MDRLLYFVIFFLSAAVVAMGWLAYLILFAPVPDDLHRYPSPAEVRCADRLDTQSSLLLKSLRVDQYGALWTRCADGKSRLSLNFSHAYFPNHVLSTVREAIDNYAQRDGHQQWTLTKTGRSTRYEEPIFTLMAADGRSFEVEAVARGIALLRADSEAINPTAYSIMKQAQAQAQQAQLGIWALEDMKPIAASDVRRAWSGGWVRVAGRPKSVNVTKKYVFINFGDYWPTDATARIAIKDWKRFQDKGLTAHALEQSCITVSGAWHVDDGPLAMITHRDQLVLAEDCPATQSNYTARLSQGVFQSKMDVIERQSWGLEGFENADELERYGEPGQEFKRKKVPPSPGKSEDQKAPVKK